MNDAHARRENRHWGNHSRLIGIACLVFLGGGLMLVARERPGQQVAPAPKSPQAQLSVPGQGVAAPQNSRDRNTDAASPFDGRRAYRYLREICSLGNRRSGSEGMRKQQEMLEEHLTSLGGEVEFQEVPARHPLTNEPVPMANLIVRWHPESKDRILLCAHYDTRPLPDRDINPRQRRRGVFLGANDGASGVSVLMELAHHVGDLPDRYGLDFVLFDGEEFVYNDRRDPYFIGSTWFARDYNENPPQHKYVAGVLLDMVGDAKLSIYQEHHSVAWTDTRPIVQEIWSTAQRLGVREFFPRVGYEVRDDHLPLHEIGKIPVCNVIDFHYPDPERRYWHTTNDTPGRCSAASLGKVGWVVYEWLSAKK